MAACGVASRRKSEELILAGRVKVNNQVVRVLGTKVDPAVDKIMVNDTPLQSEAVIYYLLNKPAGYVSTREDERGRKTVLDLLPPTPRVFPVGRLDQATRGLLLLTNDGELAYRLTHPKFEVEKEYVVEGGVRPNFDVGVLEKLRVGILLDGKKTAPATVTHVARAATRISFHITLHEGRKREVRRMCEKLKITVIDLKRVREGGLVLATLKEGQYRILTTSEALKAGEKTE